MKHMEHTLTGRSPAPDPRPTRATGDDTDKQTRDRPHFESLRVPGLISVPLFTAWLRKPFRRTDTPR